MTVYRKLMQLMDLLVTNAMFDWQIYKFLQKASLQTILQQQQQK